VKGDSICSQPDQREFATGGGGGKDPKDKRTPRVKKKRKLPGQIGKVRPIREVPLERRRVRRGKKEAVKGLRRKRINIKTAKGGRDATQLRAKLQTGKTTAKKGMKRREGRETLFPAKIHTEGENRGTQKEKEDDIGQKARLNII